MSGDERKRIAPAICRRHSPIDGKCQHESRLKLDLGRRWAVCLSRGGGERVAYPKTDGNWGEEIVSL